MSQLSFNVQIAEILLICLSVSFLSPFSSSIKENLKEIHIFRYREKDPKSAHPRFVKIVRTITKFNDYICFSIQKQIFSHIIHQNSTRIAPAVAQNNFTGVDDVIFGVKKLSKRSSVKIEGKM
jgi:hypothetical protein